MSESEVDAVERIDLRLLPAALAAWLGMWLATAGSVTLLAAGGILAAGLTWWGWRRRAWPILAAGLVVVICLITGALRLGSVQLSDLRVLAADQAVIDARLRLTGAARSYPAKGVLPARWTSNAVLEGFDARGTHFASGELLQLSVTGERVAPWSALTPGTQVSAEVRLALADPGTAAVASARAREPPTVLVPPGPMDAAVERLRSGLRASVQGLAPEPRGLVPALVVGDTSNMTEDLTSRFRVAGLTHLTAVSGQNLVLFLGFIAAVLRRLGVSGWWLRGVLVVSVGGFVLLCQSEPSVVRAAAMGLVGLAALGTASRRRPARLRPLLVAILLVVLIDPWMARSIGFTLSVLACAGLAWWAGPWSDALGRWLPRWLAEALAVPLAAQLATQPVVTAISGQISLVGIVANVVAGPLVGPATVLGFLAAATSLIAPPIAGLLGTLAGWCALALCWIAQAGAALPGSAVAFPLSPLGVTVVLGVCLTAAVIVPWVLVRPILVAGLALALLVALLRPPSAQGWPPSHWQIAFCDVGQGDATLLRAGPRDAVLVDTGPTAAPLERCLRELGVDRLAAVVLTHLHADHISGLPVAVAHPPPSSSASRQVLILSSATTPAYGYGQVTQLAAADDRVVVQPGTSARVGDVSLRIVAAAPVATAGVDEGESAAENDASLVIRAEIGGISVLLAGDCQEAGQQNALATAGAGLQADVLLIPHHGSGHQDPDFIGQVGARLAVFSVGADNDYGHPAARTVSLVGRLGLQVARTDRQGTVAVWRDERGELMVTTQR